MTEEQQLITAAQSGDRTAFRKLVEQQQQPVLMICYDLTGDRDMARDLTQEVFIRMYRSLDKFRTEARLKTWLYRIAVNTWISQRRSGAFRLKLVTNSLQDTAEHVINQTFSDDTVDPVQKTEKRDLQEKIKTALNRLSKRERAAFTMRHYHDFSIREIAQNMDITEGTVKSLLFRGLKKLQKYLAGFRPDFVTEE